MDFVHDLRDATLDAASAIGYAAKGVGEKFSSFKDELGEQMHILGSNMGHELSIVAGDLGSTVGNVAGKIGHNVTSILAKAFNDFVRLVSACETHEEEDIVIQSELARLKRKFREKDLRGNELRETLIRMVYCEMLGYEAAFGYLKAIELCSDVNIANKKAGYIASALCIPPEHEFRFMIVNRLQMDLQSKNYLEVATALIATSQLLTSDMIPALVHLVYKTLQHKESTVLCKAIILLQRFHQLDPSSVGDMAKELRRLLKSYDITVVFSCVSVLHDFVIAEPSHYKDLVPYFAEMLCRIVKNQFDHAYDFDNLPAPWVQMKVIRILAALGHNDQIASELVYVAILNSMRRADRVYPHHLSCAISADCVHAIIHLYPNEELLEEAACIIDRMVNSRDTNLKYMGLSCMAEMIQDYPQYVVRLQMVVLNSLECEDITIRSCTLRILHRMCNSQNVDIIIKRFLLALSTTYDQFQRQQLVDRICEVAERYAPEPSWYISTMTQVFAFGGRQVKRSVETNLIKIVSESQGDPVIDRKLRCLAVSLLFPLILDPLAPENLVRVATWIFGEYGHLCSEPSLNDISDALGNVWHRPALSTETKSYLVTAFMKISSQTQKIPSIASTMVRECVRSHDTELVQLAMEFREMCKSGAAVFLAAIPSKQDGLKLDFDLHFLDAYALQGRISGMKDYEERELSDDEGESGLRTEAYEAPPDAIPVYVTPIASKGVIKEGVIDFSMISGSFGVKPVSIATPNPAATALFSDVQTVSSGTGSVDLFGGMESGTNGTDLFGGMESKDDDDDDDEVDKGRVKQAAALFGGVSMTKTKTIKKTDTKPIVLKPANALFAPASSSSSASSSSPLRGPTASRGPASSPLRGPTKIAPPSSIPILSQPSTSSTEKDLFITQNDNTEDMVELVTMTVPTPTVEFINMNRCSLSSVYKVFQNEPSGNISLLSHDDHVHTAWYPIYRDGSLVICLFIKSDRGLDNIHLTMSLTDGLSVKYVTEPKSQPDGKVLKWSHFKEREQVTVLGSINFQKPTPTSSLLMEGKLVYQLEGSDDKITLDFGIPFSFVEMVREYPMSTSDYFVMWKTSKAEQKVEIKSTLRNTLLFAERANKLFHVAIVDVNDASRTSLLAGKVAGTTSTCLMEVNMTSTGCTIFIKTPSSVLCRLMADASKVFMNL